MEVIKELDAAGRLKSLQFLGDYDDWQDLLLEILKGPLGLSMSSFNLTEALSDDSGTKNKVKLRLNLS